MLRSLIIVAIACATARADSTPWATDVAPVDQRRANELFAEANELFARQAHGAALAKYVAALAIWDHPTIRFNMAVTLIRLDRFIEASDALDRAFRFGSAPFTPELYQQAMAYRALVDRRLGKIEVQCSHPGANVYLDGTLWFACPGTRTQRVLTGEHVLVGELAGQVIMSMRVSVAGGETRREAIELRSAAPAVLVYTTPRWAPWLVAGAGVAAIGGGFALRASAESDMKNIERELASRCPPACEDISADQRDAAHRKSTIGVSFMIAGAAIAIGGVVWTVLNRPRHVVPEIELAPTTSGGVARARWTF